MISLIIKTVSECNGTYTLKFYENEFLVSLRVEKSALNGKPKPKRGDVIEATVEDRKLIFYFNGELLQGK